MSDTLVHFPLYIGEALKKFIEHPTFEERGAWISIVVAMINNDGYLKDDETMFLSCLCFDEKNKQVLKQVLEKCFSKNKKGWFSDDIKVLIDKQKQLRAKRKESGRKGGLKTQSKSSKCLSIPDPDPDPDKGLGLKDPTRVDSQKGDTEMQHQGAPPDGSFFEEEVLRSGSLVWNVMEHLSLEGEAEAREGAKLLNRDFDFLVDKYNQWVGADPPKKADKGFNAWILKYTKGEWKH